MEEFHSKIHDTQNCTLICSKDKKLQLRKNKGKNEYYGNSIKKPQWWSITEVSFDFDTLISFWLCVVETNDLGEGLLRLCQRRLTQEQLWQWLSTPGQALSVDLPFTEH